ncbi:PspC domain-containing protein [Candidatus Nomurabacteria bacterium]|nr:PspC domain-containing protein [Candidatus Nomurabacteria bacterium]
MNTYDKRLYKSKDNKVIFGVMGGLGEYFNVDPVLFRVAYLGLTFAGAIAPGVIAYVLMAIVMPKHPDAVPAQ